MFDDSPASTKPLFRSGAAPSDVSCSASSAARGVNVPASRRPFDTRPEYSPRHVKAGNLVGSQVSAAGRSHASAAQTSQVPETGSEDAARLGHWAHAEYDSAHKKTFARDGKKLQLGQGACGWVELHRDIRPGHERWVVLKQPKQEVGQDFAQ